LRLAEVDEGMSAMVRLRSRRDPTTDTVAPDVIAAFEEAQEAGLSTGECYKAGVDVWRRAYPDQTAAYASTQAVEIILKAKVSLRVEA
jgi:hypothetical protein